jgi:predicted ATPase
MGIRRIAVSGGPGAGKTTLWQLLTVQYQAQVVAVPEVATLLLSHVFPQVQNPSQRCAIQRAIFAVQHNLEHVYADRLTSGQVLLCDRGTPDGGGYWPDGPEDFFTCMQSTWQAELSRYDAVLFMETAAVGGLCIRAGNPVRTEELDAAVQVDTRLRAIWQRHPNFVHVAHEPVFADKIARAQQLAQALLEP